MTNKERCKNCIHKAVCTYQDYFDNVDHLGERCKQHMSKDRITRQKAEIDECKSEIEILKEGNKNLQELYYAEKEKVKNAKQKVVDACKNLQEAKAEIERLQRLGASATSTTIPNYWR